MGDESHEDKILKQWNNEKRFTVKTTRHFVQHLSIEYDSQARLAESCGNNKLAIRILEERLKLMKLLEEDGDDNEEEEELEEADDETETDLRRALTIHG